MDESRQSKSVTRNIVLQEPEEARLDTQLIDLVLSPELLKFVRAVVKRNKWTKKITIPSTHDNTAVVLLFKSDLKDGGLEIVIQLHVFYDGKTIVEDWEMLPEAKHPASLPAETWNAIDIEKVQVEGDLVHVKLKMPGHGGVKDVIKTYDFSKAEQGVPTGQTAKE